MIVTDLKTSIFSKILDAMLIGYTIGRAIPFLVWALVIFLGVVGWKKMKKNPVAGGTIGFFVGLIPCVFLFVFPTNVYVVSGNQAIAHYLCYGSSEYTMTNGDLIKINAPMAHFTLINDSKDDLMLEHVIYGYGAEQDEFVASGNILRSEATAIDHFFGDTPPETIETSGSGTYSVRLWLRTAEVYDRTHVDQAELDHIRELLESKQEE